MLLRPLIAVAFATATLAGAANAASFKVTENPREQVAGTMAVNDPGSFVPLGTITDADSAAAYGRVFLGGTDSYRFDVASTSGARVDLQFGGLSFEDIAVPPTTESGLIGIDGEGDVTFELLRFTAPGVTTFVNQVTFSGNTTSGPPLVFNLATSEQYLLNITSPGAVSDGPGGVAAGSSYDIGISSIAAIPLPASVLLLLGAIGGLGVASRRKKA